MTPDVTFIVDKNSTSINTNSDDAGAPLRIKNDYNPDAFKDCNGPLTNMWVIVTRVKVTEVPPQQQQAVQGRLLDTQTEDVKITFGAWPGTKPKSAVTLFAQMSLALVALLAFFTF